jgi:hypothetical protein
MDRKFTNNHSGEVVQTFLETLSDGYAGMYFDRRQELPDMGDKPPQKIEAVPPRPVCEAMQTGRMEAGVAKGKL